MSKQVKEVNASILYLIGNISTKAIAFVTIPIFTRLLTTSEYGIVNTFNSWVHIVGILATLSLYNSFRSAYVEVKGDFESYCASSIRLSGLLSLACAVVAEICFWAIPSIRSYWWMAAFCIIQAYGTYCVTAMSTKYMLEFRYKRRAVYMVVPNLLCAVFAVCLLLLHTENRTFWRIFAYVAVYAAFIAVALYATRNGRTDRQHWKYAVKYSLPLVVHGLSLVVLAMSDRIMITWLRSASESGIYSLVYNLGMISTAVVTALEGIWLPWFIAKLKNDRIDEINENVRYFIENITVVVICMMLVLPEVLQFMSVSDYWVGKPLIYPIVLASYITFIYDLAVNVEYQYKATRTIAINTTVAAAMNIVLTLIFIPAYGAIAAAYTTVASYLCSMLLHYYWARKYVPGIFPLGKSVYYILACIAATIIGEFSYASDYAAVRWGIACLAAVAYCVLMFKKKRFIALSIKVRNED